jgi:RIO kinase 1
MAMKEEELYRVLEGKIYTPERREKSSEDRKTYDEVFDQSTLLTLYKMITKGVISTLDYPISSGKEGNVFRATNKEGELLAVKIYRTSTSTYKNLTKYITGDPRFRNIPKDRRGIIFLWAQKEYKNLHRMYSANIQSPEPKKLIKNVLVMEYIGCEEKPAPMLKDVSISNPEKTFESIKKMMKQLYKDAQLIHGDLSEYNILVEENECFLIDVGQSVVLEHPLSSELLTRDVTNISRYFKKLGVKINENKLIAYIRGKE